MTVSAWGFSADFDGNALDGDYVKDMAAMLFCP